MGMEQVQQIEHYHILEQISKTPFWEIYAAKDKSTQQPVWLQQFLPDLSCSEAFLTAFSERARLLSILEHPNLAKVLDNGVFEGSPYLVMESSSSMTFSDLIKEPHSIQWVAQYLLPVAKALAYLHQNHIVHGQVSEQSIRINEDRIYLINYGFYELIQEEIHRHMPQEMLTLGAGELDYLSPEQIMGKELTPQSDIYALGILLFTASIGGKPFPTETNLEMVRQRLQTVPSWPEDIHKRIPSSAIRLIQKALAKNTEDRFNTIEELTFALEKLSRGEKAKFPISTSLRKGLPQRKSLKITLKALSTCGILAALIVAGVLAYTQIPSVQDYLNARFTQANPVSFVEPTPLSQPTSTPIPSISETNVPSIQPIKTENTRPVATEIQLPVIQDQAPPTNLSVIQPENANQVQEISRLGMGKFGQVAWNPTKSEVALATSSGVYIFKSTDLSRPFFINTNAWADSVEFSPDGKLLAIGLRRGDIILWDVFGKTPCATLTGHTKMVSDLVFTSNNRYLFSASYDRTVKMWDVASGTEIKTIVAHSQPIRSIDVSRDGRLLVTGANDRLVKLWDVASSKSLKEFPIPVEVWSVAISPDSEYIASGGADGTIRQWKISSLQLRNEPITNSGGIWALQFNNQGNELFYFTDNGDFNQVSINGKRIQNKRIYFLEKPITHIAEALGIDFEYFHHEAVSADENMVALSIWDGSLLIYDLKSHSVISSIHMEFDDQKQVAFSPNNNYLITGGERQFMTLWYLPKSQMFASLPGITLGGEPFSPDSKIMAYSSDGQISTLSLETGQIIAKLGNNPGGNVLFLRNGNMLIASSIDSAKAWDVPEKAELYLTSGRIAACRYVSAQHNDEFLAIFTTTDVFQSSNAAVKWICSMLERREVNLAVANADESLLAFVNSDGLLELWNAETATRIWRSPTDHWINILTFSPDGSLLASGSTDGSITFWNVSNGQALFTLDGSYAKVNALNFSPNGKWLGSASSDSTVRLWGVVAR